MALGADGLRAISRFVRILAFPDWFPVLPETDGTEVFKSSEPLRDVATAITDGAGALLGELGEAEYKRQWIDHPFPTELLTLIREKLAD